MISRSGNGTHSPEVLVTSAMAPGVYTVALKGVVCDDGYTITTSVHSSNMSQASNDLAGQANDYFLAPGDTISFQVTGSGSPNAWAFDLYLYPQGDIAYEAP